MSKGLICVEMMRKNKSSSILVALLILVIVCVTFGNISVEAKKHHTKNNNKHKAHKHKKDKGGNGDDSRDSNSPASAPSPPLPPCGFNRSQSPIFDVLSFGAKGDGVTDDSKVIHTYNAIEPSIVCSCELQLNNNNKRKDVSSYSFEMMIVISIRHF